MNVEMTLCADWDLVHVPSVFQEEEKEMETKIHKETIGWIVTRHRVKDSSVSYRGNYERKVNIFLFPIL